MCRALGRIPTVGTFRRFYVNSIGNGWLSFSKSGGADDPCCYSKKFDTLKNWNNHFFWIDASVCPLSTSWFSGTSVVMDPLSVDEAMDIPCVELLIENRTLIRKYLETFLCFVGLIRSFTETDVLPILLHDNNEEMGLPDFFKSADPFKVKVGEQNLAENEVLLITETEDRVISPSLQIISLVDHTIQDELNVNSGKRRKRLAFVFGSPPAKKTRTEGIVISDSRPSTADNSPTALRRLIRQGEQAATGSRYAAAVTKDVTSSSVTPTLERALEDDPYDNAGTSVPVAESSSDGHPLSAPKLETRTLSATPSQGSSADDFYESQTIDSATAMNVYVPNWCVTNNARVDNSVTCRNLLDHVTPPGYWAMLRNQHDAGFLYSFNINSAQHQRDAEVAELKAKLEKLESKAAKVEELRKRVSDLEAAVAVKVGEAASLTAQNAGLLEKVSALELEHLVIRELESLKDSPLASIMAALILKDDQGGTSGFVPPRDSPVGVADYQVSTLVLPSNRGPTDSSLVVQSHDDLFDTSILDKSGDV
ncbi:hypothetical protein Tco_0758205 [Tanacetum coccineum]